MMKQEIIEVVQDYLKKFPLEKQSLIILENYLKKFNDDEIVDWNNVSGHITVGAFVYCQKKDMWLALYHKDLKMYLYPGGHVDKNDKNLITATLRELEEETGLKDLTLFNLKPIDIDIHLIPFNERVLMPEHYHFDFRYIFLIEDIDKVVVDKNELRDYQWILSSELSMNANFEKVIKKFQDFYKK